MRGKVLLKFKFNYLQQIDDKCWQNISVSYPIRMGKYLLNKKIIPEFADPINVCETTYSSLTGITQEMRNSSTMSENAINVE